MVRFLAFCSVFMSFRALAATSQPLDNAFAPNAAVCVRFDSRGRVLDAAVDGRLDRKELNSAMLRLLRTQKWDPPIYEMVGKWVAMSIRPDGAAVPEILPDCSKLPVPR